MKNLSKIIFINSAHIPYGEVQLDGNVHFTGTQGVGKSTLLRAILFFYNAEKQQLGIKKTQKSFDDFYLPYPNSYIVYEVSRGEQQTPFSILVYRQQHRASFRFVDAAFDRTWIIDERGNALKDPIEVRRRIIDRSIACSKVIDKYSDYRDILYGNKLAKLGAEMGAYSILESSQYQNIPRIIQNVFLNERVDADFIKETIIQSLQDADKIEIDLNFYREQLLDFNNEYQDIQYWTRQNKNGEKPTELQAYALADQRRIILQNEQAISEGCSHLKFAMKKAEEQIPVLRKEAGDKRELLEKKKQKLKELSSNYNDKRDKLVRQIGALSSEISTLVSRYKEFQKGNMDALVKLNAEEPALMTQKKQYEEQLDTLERQYSSIVEKYKHLIEQYEQNKLAYKQAQQTLLNDHKQANNEEITRFLKEMQDALESARTNYEAQKKALDLQITNVKDKVHELEMQIKDTKLLKPLKDEIDACLAEKQTLQDQERNLKAEINSCQAKMESLRKDAHIAQRDLEDAYCKKMAPVQLKLNDTQADIKKEQALLDKAKGSLCEWLEANVPNWKESIGKVVDEEAVLYQMNLNPRLVDDASSSVYGVELDLSELEGSQARTPEQIQRSLQELEGLERTYKHELSDYQKQLDSALAASDKKFKVQIKEQEDSVRNNNVLLAALPNQQKTVNLKFEKLNDDQNHIIAEKIEKLQEEKENMLVQIAELTEKNKSLTAQYERNNKRIRQNYDNKEAESNKGLKVFELEIQEKIKEHNQTLDAQIKELKEQQDNDLLQNGADMNLRQSVLAQLNTLKAKLQQIELNRRAVILYQNFMENEYPLKPEKEQQKAKLENDQKLLEGKFAEKKHALNEDCKQLENEIKECSDKAHELDLGLDHAKEFIESDSCPSYFQEALSLDTQHSCDEIVRNLERRMSDVFQQRNKLKELVNNFKKGLSVKNTFKFPTAFDSEQDYMDYAESIDDFVSNNKILEFTEITNETYRHVLLRVGKDFSAVADKEAEIQKIVREMNYDFSQKGFAGVIKNIELKLERSQRHLITLLQQILNFSDECANDLGELDLFSTENHDSVNKEAVKWLQSLTRVLTDETDIDKLKLADVFSLQFKIEENDNSTGWTDNIKSVGSDGTDILVKAIINILLINVFKQRVAKRNKEFMVHCMMDEIGKLADENIQGILDFANARNIYVVNSSPKAHRPLSYKRLYVLSKDEHLNTMIQPILTTKQKALL